MEHGYPIVLDLTNKPCVVVGGGKVAARKIAGLSEARARVTVISPELAPETDIQQQQFHWLRQAYTSSMLADLQPLLVFAATNDPEINQRIKFDAQAIGALVNVTDLSTESDFSSMATVHRPPLTIAFHSGGASPALVKHVREQVENLIGDEYSILAEWLGSLRAYTVEQISTQAERQQLYESLLTADILLLLREGKNDAARDQFERLVQDQGVRI